MSKQAASAHDSSDPYRRIVSGVSDAKEPYYSAKGTRVYFDNGDYNVKPVLNTPTQYHSRTTLTLLPLLQCAMG